MVVCRCSKPFSISVTYIPCIASGFRFQLCTFLDVRPRRLPAPFRRCQLIVFTVGQCRNETFGTGAWERCAPSTVGKDRKDGRIRHREVSAAVDTGGKADLSSTWSVLVVGPSRRDGTASEGECGYGPASPRTSRWSNGTEAGARESSNDYPAAAGWPDRVGKTSTENHKSALNQLSLL